MDHDQYVPFRPEQWKRAQRWIVNRILFLLHMKDKLPERFYGGDIENHELSYKQSFSPELAAMQKYHPNLFGLAYKFFMEDFPADEIRYI